MSLSIRPEQRGIDSPDATSLVFLLFARTDFSSGLTRENPPPPPSPPPLPGASRKPILTSATSEKNRRSCRRTFLVRLFPFFVFFCAYEWSPFCFEVLPFTVLVSTAEPFRNRRYFLYLRAYSDGRAPYLTTRASSLLVAPFFSCGRSSLLSLSVGF